LLPHKKKIYYELTLFFQNLKNIKTEKKKLYFSYGNLNFKSWIDVKRYNNKRLMACLRDLICVRFFKEKFKLIKKNNIKNYPYLFSNKGINWFSLNVDDLELPGDRWNVRFNLPAIIKICSLKVRRRDNISEMTRNIYDSIKKISLNYGIIKSAQEFKYYPIDMDFTFYFVPHYCEMNKCNECPFGPNGFKCKINSQNLCNFFTKNEIKCVGKENCPIFNKKGMGMCGLCFS